MAADDEIATMIQRMHDDVSTLNDAVFGYWNKGDRVPGLVEQTNSMLKLMQEHHTQLTTITERFGEVAWGIAKPIIGLLGIGVFLAGVEMFTHVKIDSLMKAAGL